MTSTAIKPPTQVPVVHITVFDTATVIDGLRPSDVVYRYDLPAQGIADGWAINAIIDQVRALSTEHWPDIEVLIDAEADHVAALTRHFAHKGVAASALPEAGVSDEEISGENQGAGVLEETVHPNTEFFPAVRGPKRDEVSALRKTQPDKSDGLLRWWPVAVIALSVIAVLSALAVIWIRSAGGGEVPASSSVSSQIQASSSPRTTTATPNEQAEPTEYHHGNLRVLLPPAFQLHSDEESNTVVAEGKDPGLRIHLAVDELYGVSQDMVFDELERMTREDEQLSDFRREDNRAYYRELPGDGSVVRWRTWVSDGYQLSVGCHTRSQATTGQNAVCTMAADSFRYTPGQVVEKPSLPARTGTENV